MARGTSRLKSDSSLADLLHCLGDIPPERIRLRPAPGTATEEDLLHILDHEDRLYELVEGTLVEKAIGFRESVLAANVSTFLSVFVRHHDLGVVTGAAGTIRLLKGLVRMPGVSFISWEQLPAHVLPEEAFPDLYPDLAAEVLRRAN